METYHSSHCRQKSWKSEDSWPEVSWKIQEIGRQFPRFSKDFLVVQSSGNRTITHAPMVENPGNRTVQMDPYLVVFSYNVADIRFRENRAFYLKEIQDAAEHQTFLERGTVLTSSETVRRRSTKWTRVRERPKIADWYWKAEIKEEWENDSFEMEQ